MRLLFAALFVLLPYLVSAEAAPSCSLSANASAVSLGDAVSVQVGLSNPCQALWLNYSCDGVTYATEPLGSVGTPICLASRTQYSFNCSYSRVGSYPLSALLQVDKTNALACGSASVAVSCGADQNAKACSASGFCCAGSCSSYPSSCPTCTGNASFACTGGNWTCAPLADGTSCGDACAPAQLSVNGSCQQGACVGKPVACTPDAFCKSVSCGGSEWACNFNASAAALEWGRLSCLGASCASPACVSVNGTPSYYNISSSGTSCSLSVSSCTAAGCCVPSCDASTGCASTIGSCADQCGPDLLRFAGACTGCGATGAAGTCAYTSRSCGPVNACQTVSCGRTGYTCRQTPSGFQWSNATGPCAVEAPHVAPPVSPPSTSGGGASRETPTLVAVEVPGETPASTPRATLVALHAVVEATVVPSGSEGAGTIDVTGFSFIPPVIDPANRTRVFAFTNSRSSLLQGAISCKGPSPCNCEVGLNRSNANFYCDVYPAVNGSYVIRLSNQGRDTGLFVANLLPGQEALLFKVTVPLRSRELLLYVVGILGLLLVGFGAYSALRPLFRQRDERPRLMRRFAEIEKELEYAKYRLLKGLITQEEYRETMEARELELTEIESRLQAMEKEVLGGKGAREE